MPVKNVCGCHSFLLSGFVVSHAVKFFHAALHVCWIKVMSMRGYVFIGRPHMHTWHSSPLCNGITGPQACINSHLQYGNARGPCVGTAGLCVCVCVRALIKGVGLGHRFKQDMARYNICPPIWCQSEDGMAADGNAGMEWE